MPLLTGTFITIAPEDITAMLGYTKDLLLDLTPLLLPIIGIALGLIVMYAVIGAIR